MPTKKTVSAVPDRFVPDGLDDFLDQQHQQDLLRFITCGSVDDGKSTLIGRLLWESHQLFDDQLATLTSDSKKFGTQGAGIDFALLVDGLSAEREQGITIDVAYRFFATTKRKFIVADTPGHEQYTRNMITGASTAQVAVLLVDARSGLMTQTRRHAYLNSLVGISHVVLAINKMDLVNFDESVFEAIQTEFREFAQNLGFKSITAIPMSALQGDNIIERSGRTAWYKGPTLMAYLETVHIDANPELHPLIFPVQWVNRPNSDFRGFSGTLAAGQVKIGDEIRITHSGQIAQVTDIVTMDGSQTNAQCGQAITLCLDREIDASRGDIISLAKAPLETTDQFEATLVWLHEDAGIPGRSYDLKLATQWSSVSITQIRHSINVNTQTQQSARQLSLNDIAVCQFATTRPLVFDSYVNCPTLGSFILVDRHSHATVGAGMITHTLRRSQNIHHQSLTVNRAQRERLNGQRGKVIWFTGLSGSGKSTLANALEVALHAQGLRTYILDGDNVRHGLNKNLGFTEADRVENIRRIAEVAKLMLDAGLVVITSFISPYRSDREMAKELIGINDFLEIYVNTPLTVCEQRDVKGLYKKARQGEIPNMTGINSPYEAPEQPQMSISTDQMTTEAAVEQLLKKILS
jgi:bifunctional enzyme CysN/CysC